MGKDVIKGFETVGVRTLLGKQINTLRPDLLAGKQAKKETAISNFEGKPSI